MLEQNYRWLLVRVCLRSSLVSSYSQVQDLITITRTSHGASVNDQILTDFTSGNATDGLLKVASITNANVLVAEAVRVLAEYEVVNASTGEIRFFTQGNHGGLIVGDTVNLRVLTGELVSGDYVVGALLSLNTVKITTSSNNLLTSGTLEFIKVKIILETMLRLVEVAIYRVLLVLLIHLLTENILPEDLDLEPTYFRMILMRI